MNTQPELIQPAHMDVDGPQLPDAIVEAQRAGAVVTGIDRGATNGSWRLSLHWPQPRQKIKGISLNQHRSEVWRQGGTHTPRAKKPKITRIKL